MSLSSSKKLPTRPATLQRKISTNPLSSRISRNNVAKIVAAIAESDGLSVQGSSRKQNEDRYLVQSLSLGTLSAVFDGHGGFACAEWLQKNFPRYVEMAFQDTISPENSIIEAFLSADRKILAPKTGFLGMVGERGVGGSKCGATGAVALVYNDNGTNYLLSANAGDARVVIGKTDGSAQQLSVDHVPDSEEERLRIEAQNPNPNMPLVRYVGGTWRVGGLLALSRAFGDAYMKGTGQFEGIQAGSDGYSSGFGVIAEPSVARQALSPEDKWIIIASDGLFANEERGGGGGVSNAQAVKICKKNSSKACKEIASVLIDAAVDAGSTDDITVIVCKLEE
eukprot:jgi/Picsp_1/3239/NSC_06079-R1_protein